ncbi:MAG: alpha/beta hydrolase [Rickettsiales bacterium]|nr:MAG: alpha/beta hydrolase [Rickettsiales bacterium]
MKKFIFAGIGGIFLVLVIWYSFLSANKYNYIFPKKKMYEQNSSYQEIFVEIGKEKFVSWYKEGDKDKPVILYFHGNGETIFTAKWSLMELINKGYGIMLVEYPEYAINGGKISEKKIIEIAKKDYEFLKENGYTKFVYYGYSIGTGVATKLATEIRPDFLILEAPFTSASGLLKYWRRGFFPQYLLKGILATDKNILKLNDISLLIIHGTKDQVVPFSMADELYKIAPTTQKRLYGIDGGGHNNLKINGGITTILEWIK